jgi:hypothetical protein
MIVAVNKEVESTDPRIAQKRDISPIQVMGRSLEVCSSM